MKVMYIVGCYPLISTTFIHREIVAMRQQGVQVEVVGMLRPKEGYILEEARREMETTFYVRPIRWPMLATAHLFYLLTRPYTYLHSFIYLVTRPHDKWLLWLKTWGHFALGPYVAWYLRKRRPDHIHAHFADRSGVVAYVAARLLGLNHSFTAHAKDIYAEHVFLPDRIRVAEFVTTCTRYNWEYLASLTDEPEKVHCIYHGLDFSDFADFARHPTTDPPMILAIGQLKEKKGFPYLIEACALLRDWGQDFHCWVIGEGPDQANLLAQIERLRLQNHVYLKGNMPFRQVLRALAQATIFTLPCVVAANQDRDGIPNVILEAMAAGVPVVSTPVSAIPEVITHNETGYLVASGDGQDLARGLAHLLNSPGERTRLAQAAQVFVRQNFDVDQNVRRLKSLFEQHLRSGARPAAAKSVEQVEMLS
jgi:glycosyltransferase involved in cell wall biosynthesis